MDGKAIVAEAAKRAQEFARKNGLIPGKNVAHPDDPIVYKLISVDGEIATVGLDASRTSDGKEVRKQFLLKELFNPCVARDLLNEVIEEAIGAEAIKLAPPSSGLDTKEE